MEKDKLKKISEFILLADNQFIKDSFDKFPVTPEYILHQIYLKVKVLLDFIELIENNKNQLKNPLSLLSIEKGISPSIELSDYIILEINSYYDKIDKMQKDGIKLPNVPDYWKKVIIDFRNKHPGHRDKFHNLKSLADYFISIKRLNSIGVDKIVVDFLEYHKKFMERDYKIKG